MSVTPATQGTWDAWVAKNKQAARFENKGWPFYDLMAPLMPQKAKGSNVFRAGAASSEREKSQSPNWDYSQMDRDFGEGEGDGDGEDDGAEAGSSGTGGNVGDDDDDTGVRLAIVFYSTRLITNSPLLQCHPTLRGVYLLHHTAKSRA